MFLEWCWKKITNLVISARKCYLRYLHYWFYTVGVNIAHKKSSSWAIKWTLLTLKVLPLAQIHKPCFPGCNVAMLSFFFFLVQRHLTLEFSWLLCWQISSFIQLCVYATVSLRWGLIIWTLTPSPPQERPQIDSQQQLISNILTQDFLFYPT